MKSSRLLRIFLVVISIGFQQVCCAQNFPISFNLVIPPPYPSNLDAYADYLQQGIIEVNNSSSSTIEVYFDVTLEQTSGAIRVQSKGVLGIPISIEPGLNILTPDQVSNIFSDLNDGDFETQGLSDAQREAILLNRQMPEGDYRICMKAVNEGGAPLSDPQDDGCTFFEVYFGERPIIVSPFHTEVVDTIDFVTMIWDHVINDVEAQTRIEYIVKVIDLTEQEITNPELAMLDPGVSPEFEDNAGILQTLILQNDVELPLIKGHHYAVRVTAVDPENLIAFKFGGHSEISSFWYGDTSDDGQAIPAPLLLSPFSGSQFEDDSNISLEWTHEITNPENNNYTLTIAELNEIVFDESEIESIDLASTNEVASFPVDTGNVVLPNEIRQLLESEKDYIWYVDIVDDNPSRTMSNKGRSQVFHFKIRDRVEDTNEGCVSQVSAELPTDRTPFEIKKQDKIKLGKFMLEVVSLDGGSLDNGYSGTGEIRIRFLNNLRLMVAFTNIKANKRKIAFDGIAEGISDDNIIPATVQVAEHIGSHVPQIGQEASAELRDAYMNSSKLISGIVGAQAVKLPLGWDRRIEGQEMVVGLTEFSFTPIKGELTAAFSIENPEWGRFLPSFAASQIVFSQDGFDKGVKMYLIRDFEVPVGENTLALKGINQEVERDTGCYVVLDCNGFKRGRITAEMTFSRNFILPDSESGQAGEGQVKALMRGDLRRGNHFILGANIEPFQIPGMEGFSLTLENASFDNSDLDNPSLAFPENYLIDEDDKTWRGFYAENITIRTPKDWMKDKTRKAISFSNLILDKQGVSTTFEVLEVIKIEEGSIDGWSFSVDTFRLEVLQNKFLGGGILGKLGVPIMDEGGSLKYAGLVDKSKKDSLSFLLNVKPDGDFVVPMMVANMNLEKTSFINLSISSEDKFAEANFTGSISIDEDILPDNLRSIAGNLDIEMPGIRFEDFYFNSNKDIQAPTFSLASPQKSLAGFSINLDPVEGIQLDKNGDDITLSLSPEVSLVGKKNGITAKGTVNFRSDLKDDYLELKEVSLSRLELDAQVNAFKFKGFVDFFNNEIEGSGAAGSLNVVVPGGIGGDFNVKFGTYKKPNTNFESYNTADFYNYWYVDGLIKFGQTGIPIFNSGMNIYGFGGGAYYRMKKLLTSDLPNPNSLYGDAGGGSVPQSGVEYQNDFNTLFGLKAMTIIGASNPNAFIADVGLEANFTKSGGVTLGLDLDGYIMSDPVTKEASITTDGSLIASNNTGVWVLDGNMKVYVDAAAGLITGCMNNENLMVDANLHVDPNKWFLYMGTPGRRGCLEMQSRKLQGYFMLGHGIEDATPALPTMVKDILSSPSKAGMEGDFLSASTKSLQRESSVYASPENAMGIAFGAELDFNLDLDLSLIYADFKGKAGFDINMSRAPGRKCGSINNVGINGWYANGQIYAGFKGEMGLKVDLSFYQGNVKLIDAAAAMKLQGGGPNPIWMSGKAAIRYSILNGLLEGRASFPVEYGSKCKAFDTNPFDQFSFIDEIKPINGSKNFPVFGDVVASFSNRIKVYNIPLGDNKFLKVKPVISSFKINNHSTTKVALIDGNLIASITPVNWLQPYKKYTAEIIVVAIDVATGKRIKRRDGSLWEEKKSVTFTTGREPEELNMSHFNYTIPLPNQKYVMIDELPEINQVKSGYLEFRSTPSYGFFDTDNYNYFINLSHGPNGKYDQYSYPLSTSELRGRKRIKFKMNTSLKKGKVYKLSLIKTGKQKPKSTYERLISQKLIANSESTDGGETTIKRKTFNVNLNKDYGLENSKSLFSISFGVSKFNSLVEKTSNIARGTAYQKDYYQKINLPLKEPFEKYDRDGYFNSRNWYKTGPLIKMYSTYIPNTNEDYFYELTGISYYGLLVKLHNTSLRSWGANFTLKRSVQNVVWSNFNMICTEDSPMKKIAPLYESKITNEEKTIYLRLVNSPLSNQEKSSGTVENTYIRSDVFSNSTKNANRAYPFMKNCAVALKPHLSSMKYVDSWMKKYINNLIINVNPKDSSKKYYSKTAAEREAKYNFFAIYNLPGMYRQNQAPINFKLGK